MLPSSYNDADVVPCSTAHDEDVRIDYSSYVAARLFANLGPEAHLVPHQWGVFRRGEQ